MRLHIAASLVCLLLSACAGPDAYERTAVRPPPPTRAPRHNPAEDAPHTKGQPGYVDSAGRHVPRGKDRRHLPPSERPGIWASDGDERRASALQTPAPMADSRPAGVPKSARDFCRQEAARLAQQAGAEGLDPRVRRCLEDRFLRLDCAADLLKRAEELERRKANWDHPFFRAVPGAWDRDDAEDDIERAEKELDAKACRDAKVRKAALDQFHRLRSEHGGAMRWADRVPTRTNPARN
ncbi:hypothetical protein ACLEPN_37825 [Myxococcus sp. 1LA]